jgi:hypothetical protein
VSDSTTGVASLWDCARKPPATIPATENVVTLTVYNDTDLSDPDATIDDGQ